MSLTVYPRGHKGDFAERAFTRDTLGGFFSFAATSAIAWGQHWELAFDPLDGSFAHV